jgi:hypothetical protein
MAHSEGSEAETGRAFLTQATENETFSGSLSAILHRLPSMWREISHETVEAVHYCSR